MSAAFISPQLTVVPAPRPSIAPTIAASLGVFRLPTDPMFFANLTLENIAIGSRYLITRASDGLELAAGEAANTTVTLTGISVYSNPMLVKIAVRKGTTAPKYIPLDAYASMTRGTVTAYISQVPDPIA